MKRAVVKRRGAGNVAGRGRNVRRGSQWGNAPAVDVPATMKALVLRGRGFENLAVADVPVPEPGENQLLARVDAAGVCTSNLKLIAQGPDHTFINGWDLSRWPVILGDEGVVTLVKVGARLRRRYRAGERFAIQPAVDTAPILHRERYRDEAAGMRKCAVGYTLPGHLAQYILIQEEVLAAQCLLPLPDAGMPYFAAALAEPISCCHSAQERHVHLLKDGPQAPRRAAIGLLRGGVAAISGAGVMGRMHAELALRFAPRVLIVADLLEARLRRARADLSAKARRAGTRLLCVTPADLPAVVARESGGRGVDDLVLAVGIRDVQQQALALLADGGVANLFGGLPRGQHMLELDALRVHYGEIRLVGSSGGEPSDLAAALASIAAGEIDPGNYVAAVGSLHGAVDVLRMVKDGKLEGRAVLYPHLPLTPLKAVSRWDGAREQALLEKRRCATTF